MNALKKIFIALIVGAATVLCLYGGLWALVFHMAGQRSCDDFNIDNIELHAGVDIPNIEDSDCNYDGVRTMKQAWFLIDKNSVDMDYYIGRNKFLLFTDTSNVGYTDFLNLDTVITASNFSKGDLYYTKGSAKRKSGIVESWKTLFDKRSGKLWATIYYNDKQK